MNVFLIVRSPGVSLRHDSLVAWLWASSAQRGCVTLLPSQGIAVFTPSQGGTRLTVCTQPGWCTSHRLHPARVVWSAQQGHVRTGGAVSSSPQCVSHLFLVCLALRQQVAGGGVIAPPRGWFVRQQGEFGRQLGDNSASKVRCGALLRSPSRSAERC